MVNKVHQQVECQPIQNNTEEPDILGQICVFITNYLIHIILHLFAINYLLVYILFKDAQENYSYMIDDVKDWSDTNLIITFTILYCTVYIHGMYLAKKYSHHIISIISCSVFYGLIYTNLALSQIIDTNCEKRNMLSCSGTNKYLSNSTILMSKLHLNFAMLCLVALICIYTICIIYKNMRVKYYYYANPIKEFVTLIILYYFYGFLVFMIPILICICCAIGGDNNQDIQLDMGNFVNGIDIIPISEGVIQEV